MNGAAGQAFAIAQELCKDWVDDNGNKHPGLYDENNEYMKKWAEAFPKAVPGSLLMAEPRKIRTAMYEAGKVLVPLGVVKFPPNCPKGNILVLDDGTNYQLEKRKENSLIQMDLMKEEMALIVRIKSAAGNYTYRIPPEKEARGQPDDRATVAFLALWWLYQIRTDDVLGEPVPLDYSTFFTKTPKITEAGDQWLKGLHSSTQSSSRTESPFKGKSPFGK